MSGTLARAGDRQPFAHGHGACSGQQSGMRLFDRGEATVHLGAWGFFSIAANVR